MDDNILFDLEMFQSANSKLNSAIDNYNDMKIVFKNTISTYINSIEKSGYTIDSDANINKDLSNISLNLDSLKDKISNFKESMSDDDDLEYENFLIKLAEDIKNTDYKDIYGDCIMGSDIVVPTELLNLVGHNIIAPGSELLGNIGVSLENLIFEMAADDEDTQKAKICIGAVNTFVALAEGVVDFFETLADSLGPGMVAHDAAVAQSHADMFGFIFGGVYKTNADNLREANEAILKAMPEAVSTEMSKELFNLVYSTEIMQTINENSYSVVKRGENGNGNGFFYDSGKAVGYYVPIMFATNGLVGGESGITKGIVQGAITKVTSDGKYKEQYYAQAINNAREEGREVTLKEIAVADAKAGVISTIDAAVVAASSVAKVKATDKANTMFAGLDDQKAMVDAYANAWNIGVKGAKPTISALAKLAFGEEIDWGSVLIDTAAVVGSEYVGIAAGKKAPKVPKAELPTTGSEMAKELNNLNSSTWIDIKNGFWKDTYNRAAKETIKEYVKDNK